jgi:hypothetical protein
MSTLSAQEFMNTYMGSRTATNGEYIIKPELEKAIMEELEKIRYIKTEKSQAFGWGQNIFTYPYSISGNIVTHDVSAFESFLGLPKPEEKQMELELEDSFDIKSEIKQVIYSGNTTIVLWLDGTKTIVKTSAGDEGWEGDSFDPEVGLAMCIVNRLFGSRSQFMNLVEKSVKASNKRKPSKKDSWRYYFVWASDEGNEQDCLNGNRLVSANSAKSAAQLWADKSHWYGDINVIKKEFVDKNYPNIYNNLDMNWISQHKAVFNIELPEMPF